MTANMIRKNVHFSATQWARISELAKACNMSAASFIRICMHRNASRTLTECRSSDALARRSAAKKGKK